MKSLTKTLLTILGAGALIVVAAAAPNALQVLAPLVAKRRGRTNRRSLERALKRLQERRLVKFVSAGGKTKLQITEAGKRRLREFELDEMCFQVPRRWDGQWTVILFDIPEKLRRGRDALRQKLTQLKCFPYHKSVFVHPADCRDEIDFLGELFGINPYIIHFRAPSLGKGEHRARRFFKLI